mgnify:FL=1
MRKLFGTDGIRGVANRYPMTAELALDLGRAVVSFFSKGKKDAEIIIGKDSRISGDMLESALCAGICSMGADAIKAGILPTPAVAFLAAHANADAGIVISASHNPYQDNGLKLFSKDGFKLTDENEEKIEFLMTSGDTSRLSEGVERLGKVKTWPDSGARYTKFLKNSLDRKSVV